MPILMRGSPLLSILQICLFASLMCAQSDPTFTTFEGPVYSIPYKKVDSGYGKYLEDCKVLGDIRWKKIDVSERYTFDPFPDVNRKQRFGMVLSSTMTIPQKGCYEFSLNSDDGSILWYSHKMIIDNDHPHRMREKKDTFVLNKGIHPIKIWYYQGYPTSYGFLFDARFIGPDSLCHKIIDTTMNDKNILLAGDFFFDSDQFKIKLEALNKLDSICQEIEKRNPKKIIIRGFTDDIGDAIHNEKLSMRRANSIHQAIINSTDLRSTLFTLIGRGEYSPKFSNDHEEGRSKNRRVEISIE